jgi:hypothetical protein
MTFRDELRERLQWVYEKQTGEWADDLMVNEWLDELFAHRSAVECPTCGGTGKVASGNCWPGFNLCPAGCIDGRVPRPERLAVVKPAETIPYGPWLFILAPDQPEEES